MKKEIARLSGALVAFAIIALVGWAASACDCPGENDTATFSFGTASLVSGGGGSGSIYSVPLLVSTQETTTFTQLTVNFGDLALYVEESAVVGSDVGGSSSVTEFPDEGYVTIQVVGTLTGCDQEVAVLEFERLETNAAPLEYDDTDGGPNSLCHVNYTIHHGLDGKITPTDICFEGGAAKANGDDTSTEPATWTTAKALYR
jgi:hypothetical protein